MKPTIYLLLTMIAFSNLSFADSRGGADFRNLFLNILAEEGFTNTKSNTGLMSYDHLVFTLPPELLIDEVNTSKMLPATMTQKLSQSENHIKGLAHQFSGLRVSDLYQSSKEQPIIENQAIINSTLKSRNITVVIVPGYIGEWIETNPFSEVVDNRDSLYHRLFFQKLAESPMDDFNFSMPKISIFNQPKWRIGLDLETMPNGKAKYTVKKSLGNYFSAGSIDVDGQSQVKALVFTNEPFSLESVQKIDVTAQIYLRRLNKFMELMAEQDEEIIILGYSRGAPIALEMLARANENPTKHPWLKKVKAMVSMGGVIYGSAIADQYLIQGTPEQLRIQKINNWIEKEGYNGAISGASLLTKLNENSGAPDFSLLMNNLGLFVKNLSKSSVWAPKVALTAEKTVEGLIGLSTTARLKWWQNPKNKLPLHLIYYGLPAVMSPPESPENELEEALANSDATFALGSVDLNLLRGNYSSFIKAASLANEPDQFLNDSQVALFKTMFWPKLNANLNDYYSKNKMKTQLLGVLGSHHWGMAYNFVFRSETFSDKFNPYPRKSLLKAIALSVALENKN